MRLTGILVGALLMIVVVYILDMQADGIIERRMVNWDVVGERLSEMTSGIQKIWSDFTREITGPT